MSGHSKWSQIKHKKAASDQKKGQLFSKLGKQITIAVREGGADPASNFKLRLVMEQAKKAQMPKENIQRAIDKANGSSGESELYSVTYEGFGPFGTAFLVDVVTDNKNRSASSIRHLFEKFGGSLGQPNSVSWNFESKGQILADYKDGDVAEQQLAAIDAGAEDVRVSEEGLEVYTTPLEIQKVKDRLESIGFKVVNAEIIMQPKNLVKLNDSEKKKIEDLYEAFNNEEEVVSVHTSADL